MATVFPWCDPQLPLTKEHLQTACGSFAYQWWANGLLPAEALMYPVQPEWFTAALKTMASLEAACHNRWFEMSHCWTREEWADIGGPSPRSQASARHPGDTARGVGNERFQRCLTTCEYSLG